MSNEPKLPHPECCAGEVFLGNIPRHDLRHCGWRSKRLGDVAYNEAGDAIEDYRGLRPLFALRSELKAAGVKFEVVPEAGE